MTEQDWLTDDDPCRMLRLLDGRIIASGAPEAVETSDRKLRLFAVACTRQQPRLDDDIRQALVMAESHVDQGTPLKWTGSVTVCYHDAAEAARMVLIDHFYVHNRPLQAALLREVFGNPWRQSVVPFQWVPKDWLTPTVLSLAQAAYEERLPDGTLDPVRLAVLADALEEAGCVGDSPCRRCGGRGEIRSGHPMSWPDCGACGGTGRVPVHPLLAHLREPGPHVRGCWALDIVLGES